MAPEEQTEFVNQLIENVRKEIVANINFMPQDWDGIELRQYIADKFSEVVLKGTMTKRRKTNYEHTLIINRRL